MNRLWLVWAALFVILETLGLLHIGGMEPLTYWVRELIANPATGWAVAAASGWLVYHFFVEPLWRKRKDSR